MNIFQGSKRFKSLEQLQKGLDIDGRRITIQSEERVATIRPSIVQNFPGTIEQLYELGLKLGGTPTEIWKRNKKRCEEHDERREKALAITLQVMDSVFNGLNTQLRSEVSEVITSMIEFGVLQSKVEPEKFSKISDALLEFRVTEDDSSSEILALEKANTMIRQKVDFVLGTNVGRVLLSRYSQEVQTLAHDPHSPYFDSEYENASDQQSMQFALFKMLMKHPDLLNHMKILTSRLTNEFYSMSPMLLQKKPTQNRRISESRNGIKKDADKEWDIDGFVKQISPAAVKLLLEVLFYRGNPLTAVHEYYMFAMMTKDVVTENVFESMTEEQKNTLLDSVDEDVPIMQELMDALAKNPQFMNEFISVMEEAEEEENENEDDLEDEYEDEDEENDFGIDLSFFKEEVLNNERLTWKAKAISAYVFFIEEGYCVIESIIESGIEKKQTVRAGLKELEEEDLLIKDEDNEFVTFWSPEDLFYENQEKLEQITEIIIKEDLSWKAKGVALYLLLCDGVTDQLLEVASSDSKRAVKVALSELQDQGYISTRASRLAEVEDEEQKYKEALALEKIQYKAWYDQHLSSLLRVWLNETNPPTELLNARYPGMNNLSALDLAVISDDSGTVRKLLLLDGIQIEFNPKTGGLAQTAISYCSFESLKAVLEYPQVSQEHDEVFQALMQAISDEIDIQYYEVILKTGVELNQVDFMDSPLQAAVGNDNVSLSKLLLDYGADPEFLYVGPVYMTLRDYVEAKGSTAMKKLFQKYKKTA